ncbi:MBL fold metallo-hydrolase [Candidatus Entotheonella palauensis]|nr:MBL fold metallo-hydrolase [Candidatus Entotheonella palauensis]
MSEQPSRLNLCCSLPSDAKAANPNLFEIQEVADGIYAAIATPQYKVNSNAAIIVTNDGTVVVDSHSKPSAAQALHQHIRDLSQQPVHKLINTHFHWDHWQGNEVYAKIFPELSVITSERTRHNLTTPGIGVGGVAFINQQIEALPAEIDQLKNDIVHAANAEEKSRLETHLQQAEAFLEELRGLNPILPTQTVAQSMTLNEGGREIQLLLLGRAHTDGDLFIYLPKEKVIITGDAVVDWMPFLGDGYPEEWIGTLDALEQLDFTHMILGHGNVAPKSHVSFFRSYLTDLIDAVKRAAADGATVAEMQVAVADQLAPQYEQGMSKYPLSRYRDRIESTIEIVYHKVVHAH